MPTDTAASGQASAQSPSSDATLAAEAPRIGWVLFALSIAAFASASTLRVGDTLLPAIADDFTTTPGTAAIIVTVFAIFYGGVQFIVGPLGDRLGKLRVIGAACALSALSSVACALAPDLEWLTVARSFGGLTAGALIPLSMAWVGDAVPFEHRQQMLARFLLGQILGLVFGQAAAGVVAELFGWRDMFLILSVLFVIAGGAMLAAVLRHEPAGMRRITAARPPIRTVLRDPHVRLVLITVFLESLVYFSAYAFAASDLHDRGGLSLAHAGIALGFLGLGGLVYAVFVGRFVRILRRSRLPLIGASLQTIGFIAMALAPRVEVVVPAVTLVGLGFYMFHNTLQTEATQMVPSARGFAVSLFASMFFAGQSVGVAIGGVLYDWTGAVPLFVFAAVSLPVLAGLFGVRMRDHP